MEQKIFSQVLAAITLVGYIGISSAATCSTTDVMIDIGIQANSCGAGSTSNDTVMDADPPANYYDTWQVNIDNAGGMNNWAFYEKEENNSFKDSDGNEVNPPGNDHDGNTSGIGFESTTIGDPFDTGTFSIDNATDPFLIVLKDGKSNLYQWYYFEGLSGSLNGTWNDIVFDPKALSHMTVYTKTVVPVPAAVWLFGSGLLGLVGIARRKRAG